MPPNPPQTLSVKRKRNDPVVDLLVVGGGEKRQKSDNYAWRIVPKPGENIAPPLLSPAYIDRPQFHVSYTSGTRVLVQTRLDNGHPETTAVEAENGQNQTERNDLPSAPVEEEPVRPRKRPGARAAIHASKPSVAENGETKGPSEDEIKQFEQFSNQVEQEEAAKSKLPPSPLKFKPKVPTQRYKERHPEKAAALYPDAMDVDDYVYDTYIREVIVPDAQGKLPEPQGTVGVIMLKDEDEDWWNGDDESDKEFDTDDEDENAEDYYANDYPEDEVDSDDEFDRNLYQSKFRHGSDDEEYDLNDESDDEGALSDENEDDEHFRKIANTRAAPRYWGRAGEI